MRTKDYIEVLLENGFHFNTLSKWDSKQIRTLGERFVVNEITRVSKDDTKTKQELETKKVPYEVYENEDELSEKFESKAQQGLFWAKCKNSTGKTKEKWCKMAEEFSDSTSKKQYKDMPDKKHPEKTVKKKTNEDLERYLEDKIVTMLDEHINPTMTKGQLLKTLNERKESMMLKNPKKNTMFSQDEGKEMKGNTKERTKTKPDTDKGKDRKRSNPFKDPNPGVKENPKAEMKENTKERTKEREKTKTPTRRKGNPFKDPNPGVKENPKASKEKQKSNFMLAITQALK
jgi:hypothetical protein